MYVGHIECSDILSLALPLVLYEHALCIVHAVCTQREEIFFFITFEKKTFKNFHKQSMEIRVGFDVHFS